LKDVSITPMLHVEPDDNSSCQGSQEDEVLDDEEYYITTEPHTPSEAAKRYPYTKDLQTLEGCKPAIPPTLPVLADAIKSPLILDNWRQTLQDHPDRDLVDCLLHGIAHGFHIGFNHGTQQCESTQSNMGSAIQNPGPVDEYIDTELKAGWIVGPFKPEEIPSAQVSRFGVIPKRGQPGRWRLILDLSSSQNRSVNDGIDKELCSLKYASMDGAAGIIQEMGAGTLLAKVDLEHAYQNIPIHRDDRLLLAMRWRGKL